MSTPTDPLLMLGIAGTAYSGKDELTKYLVATYGFIPIRIAQPLEDLLLSLYGERIPVHYRTQDKEGIIPGVGKSWRELMQTAGAWYRAHSGHESRRMIAASHPVLDRIYEGIQMLPNEREDLLAERQWFSLPEHCQFLGKPLLFTDVRLPEEALFIRRNCGSILHIHRDTAKAARPDITETRLVALEGEIIIRNNGTFADLRMAADAAVAALMPHLIAAKTQPEQP